MVTIAWTTVISLPGAAQRFNQDGPGSTPATRNSLDLININSPQAVSRQNDAIAPWAFPIAGTGAELAN
jgi:hypothetical protein